MATSSGPSSPDFQSIRRLSRTGAASDFIVTLLVVLPRRLATLVEGDRSLGAHHDPEDERQEWLRLTPLERWSESMKSWTRYLAQGGSLDPKPDSQSSFDFPELRGEHPVDGRPVGRRIDINSMEPAMIQHDENADPRSRGTLS